MVQMFRYSDTLTQEIPEAFGPPIVGALVAVKNQDGTTPVLYADDGTVLGNPLTTDQYGVYYFNVTSPMYVDLKFYYGARLIRENFGVPVGPQHDVTDVLDLINAYIGQFGIMKHFDTVAAMNAAIGTIAANEAVIVWKDENHGNRITYYQKTAGVMVLKADPYAFGGAVSLLDFGAVNDNNPSSAATNGNAMAAFGTYGRMLSASGLRVHVVAPPGVYYYDGDLAQNAFQGISNLHFSGYGCTFINSGNESWGAWPWSNRVVLYLNSSNPLIANASKGATTVTALTPSEVAQYVPGEWIMVAGLDLQFNGYPPNLNCFDFVKVATVNSTTGVVTFTAATPLTYDYLANWPGDASGTENYKGARLYKLAGYLNGYSWDVDHIFEGVECRTLTDAPGNYVTPAGRKITWRDATTPGFAESVCGEFTAINCIERLHTEPDKLVKKSTRRDGDLRAGLTIQSGSVDVVSADNCRITQVAFGGKTMRVTNCNIDSLAYAGGQGFNSDSVLENCRINNDQDQLISPGYTQGSPRCYVDGVNVTYANGVFTILKNNVSAIAQGGGMSSWNTQPGQLLQFCRGTAGDTSANGCHLASDVGTGIVMSVIDGVGSIQIITTLPQASVPSWSSGQVQIKRRNFLVMRNCSGDDFVRLASEASRAGKNFGEYFRYLIAGKDNISSNQFLPGKTGKLRRLYANVIKPITGTAGATAQLSEATPYVASTMAAVTGPYRIILDLTIAGVRDFTTTALTGKVGNDAVSLNGVAQTTLIDDMWSESGFSSYFTNYAPTAKNLTDLPIIDLIWEFDLGLWGKRVTATRAMSTAGTAIVGTAGVIQ